MGLERAAAMSAIPAKVDLMGALAPLARVHDALAPGRQDEVRHVLNTRSRGRSSWPALRICTEEEMLGLSARKLSDLLGPVG